LILTALPQDAEQVGLGGGPAFLLKLSSDDDLVFTFTFVIRKSQNVLQNTAGAVDMGAPSDTQINGLTFVFASTPREVENLVTREFHADPNLHKNANVALVGSYSTEGSPSVTFDWTWRWKPPKITEDRGGGWRNSCSVGSPQANSLVIVADAGSSLLSTTSGPIG
jgi:Arf-GAP/SH3 domain/ANK repeat/PH domain-containing protein